MKFLENPRAHFAREMELDQDVSQNVVRFVVDNFFDMYHLDSITENNLNHFFDFMKSYRDCYHELGLYELVDCANYVLDSLVILLPNIGDFANDKYQYRSKFYRPPEDIHFIEPVNASVCLAKLREREKEFLDSSPQVLTKTLNLRKSVVEALEKIDVDTGCTISK